MKIKDGPNNDTWFFNAAMCYALPVLAHLILSTFLQGWYLYFSSLTDVETEPYRSERLLPHGCVGLW